MDATEIWKLYARDDVVAELVVTGGDFPWLEARVEPRPGLERYRALFDAEWAASQAEDWEAADRIYGQFQRELRLVDANGVEVAEFLLHIQGRDAWWRWSYEPFDDENEG